MPSGSFAVISLAISKMKNFNEELFLNDLAAFNWQRILICSQDINEVALNWTSTLSLVVEKHAPLIEINLSLN